MEAIKKTRVDKSVSCQQSLAGVGSRAALDRIDSQSVSSENKSVVFKKPFQVYGTSPASRRIVKNRPIVVGSLSGLKKIKLVPQKYIKINKTPNEGAGFSSVFTSRVAPINVSRVEDMNATFNEVTGNVKLIHSKANSLLPPKANGDAFNICQESNLGSHTMTIVNQYNGLSHSSRTVATLNSGMENGEFESFTSDNLVNLIGQENYNVLFAALCTISSTDLKRKAIRTLLTKQTVSKKYSEISVQTPNWDRQYILTHDVSCQTLGKLVKDKSVNTDSTQDFQTNSSSFTTRQFKKRRRCPTRRQSPYVIDTRNFVNKIDHKKMITERDMKLEYQQNIVVHRRKISMPPPSGKFSEDSGYSSLKGVQGNDEKIGVHAKEDFKEDNVKSLNVTSTELEKVYLNKVTKTTENITYKSFNIFDNDNGTEIGSTIGTSVCSEPFDISESILNDPIGPLERYLPSVTKPMEFVMKDDEREVPELVESNPPLLESRQEPFNYGKPNLNNEIQELLNGVKPEDKFHLVPKESANTMSPDRLKRLINHQMIVDWEYCLHPDELGYLPIHNAVLNNDIPWLQRQCLVLKSKGENVDVGDEQTGMSALQLAVNEHSNISCIKVLLKHGANMFYKDDRSSTVLHYCIESEDEQYTNYFIIYMEQNPKTILEAAGLKTLEEKEENKQLVLRYANSIYDENGLTPLMLAAKLGRPHSIDSLLETVGDPTELVNMRCAKSGDTALMLAVKSASAADSNNRSTVPEQYLKTIEKLFSYGADPDIENFGTLNVASLVSENQIPCLVNAVSGVKNFKTTPNKLLFVDNLIHTKNSAPPKQIVNKTVAIANSEEHKDYNEAYMDLNKGIRSEAASKAHNKPDVIDTNGNICKSALPHKVTSDNLNAVSVIKVVDKPIAKPQVNNVVQVVMNDGKTIWHKIQRPVENNVKQRVENAPAVTQINSNANKNIVMGTTHKSSTVTSQNINSKPKTTILQNITVSPPLNTSTQYVNGSFPARLLPKVIPKTISNFSATTASNKIVMHPTDVGMISRPVSNTAGGSQNVTSPVHNMVLSKQNSGPKPNGQIKMGEFVVKANSIAISNTRTSDQNELKATVQAKRFDNTNLARKLQIDAEKVVTERVQTRNANSIAAPIRLINTHNIPANNGSRVWMDYAKLGGADVQKKLKLMKSFPIIATGLNSGNRQNQTRNVSDALIHLKGSSYLQPSKTGVAVNQIATNTGLSSEINMQNSTVDSSKNENIVHRKPANIDIVSDSVHPPDNYGKLKQLGKLLDEKSKIKTTALKIRKNADSARYNTLMLDNVNKTELSTRVLGKRSKKVPKRYTPDNLSSPSRPKYKRNSSSSDS